MEKVVYDVWLIGYKADNTISDIDVCVKSDIEDMQNAIDFAESICTYEGAMDALDDSGVFTGSTLKYVSDTVVKFNILVEEAHVDDDDDEYDGFANCVYDEWTSEKQTA